MVTQLRCPSTALPNALQRIASGKSWQISPMSFAMEQIQILDHQIAFQRATKHDECRVKASALFSGFCLSQKHKESEIATEFVLTVANLVFYSICRLQYASRYPTPTS
jgi:hypothetical protein